MTARRSFGWLTLLAMMHFIIVGTASACAAPRDSAREASSAHASCEQGPTQSKSSNPDRATELPCCAALASCATIPMAARAVAIAIVPLRVAIDGAIAERAPRADSPAPELPPPKA